MKDNWEERAQPDDCTDECRKACAGPESYYADEVDEPREDEEA